jgi:hypothetical protein
MDGGLSLYVRDLSKLTDAQLEALIQTQLEKHDPAAAAEYAAADGDNRTAILKRFTGSGE